MKNSITKAIALLLLSVLTLSSCGESKEEKRAREEKRERELSERLRLELAPDRNSYQRSNDDVGSWVLDHDREIRVTAYAAKESNVFFEMLGKILKALGKIAVGVGAVFLSIEAFSKKNK